MSSRPVSNLRFVLEALNFGGAEVRADPADSPSPPPRIPSAGKATAPQATQAHAGRDGSNGELHAEAQKARGAIEAREAVERGDGKVTATKSSSVTQTSKTGTGRVTDRIANVGPDAKDGSIVAHGGLDSGKSITSKKGLQAGMVAGVHANVACEIGDPKGDPPMYEVTLTVSFEGSAGISAGAGKNEGSKASIGVEAKGSLEKSMSLTHVLDEAQLAEYTQALKDASTKGGRVSATHREFAIVSVGVNQGWEAARLTWSNQPISKASADALAHKGDSMTVKEKTKGSVGADAKAGAIGLGVSVAESQEDSKQLTRNDDGALDIEAKSAHSRQSDLSGELDLGAVGLSVGRSHTHQTSFGYSITIDPKNDPDGSILEALGSCKSQDQFEAFIRTYERQITLAARTKGKSDADTMDVGVSAFGQELSIGTHTGVDVDSKTDADGKLLHKTVAGHSGAGGKAGPLADSRDDDATAEIDGDGGATLDIKSTKRSNHNSRARRKHLKHVTEALTGQDMSSGIMALAAGGDDEDSTTHDVAGLVLTTADLKKLGSVACNSIPAFVGAARRWQDKDDLRDAAVAIRRAKGAPAVVAEQLARFIGGGIDRKEAIERWVRGGYHSQMGHAYEFPDDLRDIVDDYNEVVDDKLPERMDILANKKGNDVATAECRRLSVMADKIEPQIRACNDFENAATKAEMLSRLSTRRQLLNEAVIGYGGLGDKADNDPKVLEEKCNRLMRLCGDYFAQQNKIHGELCDADTITSTEKIAVRKIIKKLEDLQFRWQIDYNVMLETFAKRGMPMPAMPFFVPDYSIVTFFEKKIGPNY